MIKPRTCIFTLNTGSFIIGLICIVEPVFLLKKHLTPFLQINCYLSTAGIQMSKNLILLFIETALDLKF